MSWLYLDKPKLCPGCRFPVLSLLRGATFILRPVVLSHSDRCDTRGGVEPGCCERLREEAILLPCSELCPSSRFTGQTFASVIFKHLISPIAAVFVRRAAASSGSSAPRHSPDVKIRRRVINERARDGQVAGPLIPPAAAATR